MKTWTKGFDMASIPDDVLASEVGRRRVAKRKTAGKGGGRPKVLRPCPRCGEMLGAAEMRAHAC